MARRALPRVHWARARPRPKERDALGSGDLEDDPARGRRRGDAPGALPGGPGPADASPRPDPALYAFGGRVSREDPARRHGSCATRQWSEAAGRKPRGRVRSARGPDAVDEPGRE